MTLNIVRLLPQKTETNYLQSSWTKKNIRVNMLRGVHKLASE